MSTGIVLRTRTDAVSLKVSSRTSAVTVVVVALTLVTSALALTIGDFRVPLGEVLQTLVGQGTQINDYVVLGIRLPRLLTGLLVGAALAAGGAVFQSLTRNPLGSPDVVGATQGAATGALLVILVFGGGVVEVALGSMVGAMAIALLVIVMCGRALHGYRIVLVGIGVSATLLAVNNFLLSRANLETAQVAQAWLVGSLNVRGWQYAAPLAVALAVLLVPVLAMIGWLRMLELGDDTAAALGVPVVRARLGLLLLGAALAGVAVAAAGPVIFVALAAPQIARKLSRSDQPVVLLSALTGALLLAAGDLAAQRLFAPIQLPVGIATGTLGGFYLAWLLAAQWRSDRG